jgi:hypothetical protein
MSAADSGSTVTDVVALDEPLDFSKWVIPERPEQVSLEIVEVRTAASPLLISYNSTQTLVLFFTSCCLSSVPVQIQYGFFSPPIQSQIIHLV